MGKRGIRVRSKRLAQIDESKMWLALYLMARDLVEDRTTSLPSEKVAERRPDEEKQA